MLAGWRCSGDCGFTHTAPESARRHDKGFNIRHFGDPQLLLKVYLRDPSLGPVVKPILRAWAGRVAPILFLHGEICRRELDIETVAVYSEADADSDLRDRGSCRPDPCRNPQR